MVQGIGVDGQRSISELLLASYAPGTLRSSALGRCSAFLEASEGEFANHIQGYLLSLMAPGCSGAPVRQLLSGLALVEKLRLFGWVCPKIWWRLPKVGTKLGYTPRFKGTPGPEWFGPMLEVCASPADYLVTALCVLAFAFGLRVSEAEGLCEVVRGQTATNPEKGFVWFKPAKRDVARCRRSVTPYVAAWVQFVELVSQVAQVRLGEAWCDLVRRAGLPNVSFHGWRRACAQSLFGFGVSVQRILFWCRWETPGMLRCYLGDDFRWSTPKCQIPLPPCGSVSGNQNDIRWVQFEFGCFWPEALRISDAGNVDQKPASIGAGGGVDRAAKRCRGPEA